MLVCLGIWLWGALLGLRIYRCDLYHKAPWPMLFAALAAGYGAMWLLGDLEDHVADLWDVRLHELAAWAMIAATHEELAKLIIVVGLALACRRHFRDPMDGLVYGAFAGLGFALAESSFYRSLRMTAGIESLGTEAVRLLLHALLGGLSAVGVGMASARIRRWPMALLLGWTAAVTLHFLWDYHAGMTHATAGAGAGATVTMRLTAAALVLAAVSLFGAAAVVASRWSREIFDPRSPRRLWGWPFVRGPARAPMSIGPSVGSRRSLPELRPTAVPHVPA